MFLLTDARNKHADLVVIDHRLIFNDSIFNKSKTQQWKTWSFAPISTRTFMMKNMTIHFTLCVNMLFLAQNCLFFGYFKNCIKKSHILISKFNTFFYFRWCDTFRGCKWSLLLTLPTVTFLILWFAGWQWECKNWWKNENFHSLWYKCFKYLFLTNLCFRTSNT